jgi:hypothetical protein
MRIDTQTIQSPSLAIRPDASAGAPTGAMLEPDLVASAARWLPIVATVLATTAAVLLASGLAVMMSLS